MIFAYDERSLECPVGNEAGWCEGFEATLDHVSDLLERGHSLAYSDRFFVQHILPGLSFYDLLAPDHNIQVTGELAERVASIFFRAQRLEDVFPYEGESTVDFGAGAEEAATVAWIAARYISEGLHTPCLSCTQIGTTQVGFEGSQVPVHFVGSTKCVELFFRWMILNTTSSPSEMDEMSTEAFSGLEFLSGAVDGIKAMRGTYKLLLPKIVHDLSFLSDNGRTIFSQPWKNAPASFGQGYVNASDENGRTKQNGEARRQRTRDYKGKKRVFWWHIKLQPHQNRIHFSPDDVGSGGRILIGIFCEHLVT